MSSPVTQWSPASAACAGAQNSSAVGPTVHCPCPNRASGGRKTELDGTFPKSRSHCVARFLRHHSPLLSVDVNPEILLSCCRLNVQDRSRDAPVMTGSPPDALMGCGQVRDHLNCTDGYRRTPTAINTICTGLGGGHHLRFIDCDPSGRGGYSGEH